MGIQATVVYDSNRHAPVVVRSSSTTVTSTGVLADTIASFSEHISTMKKVAATPAEVCALWGGPPYITYALVRKRYRVIVIWDVVPGELDVAYDVHYCVSTLQSAVAKHAVQLSKDDTESIAAVYEAAGHALLGGDDEYVRVESHPNPKHDNGNGNTSSNIRDDEPLPSPTLLKKKTAGIRKLFGRNKRSEGGISFLQKSKSDASAISRTESGLTTATETTVLDNEPSKLNLPPEVFNWADFGNDLPASSGDISWIAQLLRGDEHRAVVAAPVFAKDGDDISNATPSVSSIPLAQPMSPPPMLPPAVSSAKPISPTSSTAATTPTVSALSPNATINSPASAAATSPVRQQQRNLPLHATSPSAATPISAASVSSNASVPISMPAVPVIQKPLTPVSPQPSPVLAVPSPQQQQPVLSAPVQPTPVQQARVLQPSVQQMLAQQQSIQQMHTQQQPVLQPAYSNGIVQPANHAATSMQPSLSTQQSSGFRGRGDAGDDFDVSALGGVKDSSSNGNSASANAGAADPIRGMMNTFAKTMQSGDFPGALNQVYATLRTLATLTPRRKKETLTCTNYVLALKIMQRVGSGNNVVPVEAALLTMFMAELKHLLPIHRTAAMRMAIDKNLAVGNFGMAARWMRQLPSNIQNGYGYGTKLTLCIQRGECNAHMPPTNKLCYNLLAILAPPYGKCTECTAVYKPGSSGVQIGQKCPTCFYGSITVSQ